MRSSNSNSNSNRASSSSSSAAENEMASSCRRSASTKRAKIIMMPCRKLGKYLKQQQGRLYIIRRCVVMLICWRD